MKAVILAAGIGRRMRPFTDRMHKTLLPIAGTTILGRIVDSLRACGVEDVTVVTGYRDAELRAFLAERYPDARFSYVHNPRYRETNNIASLALVLAGPPARDDVLLIESDLIYEPEVIRRLVDAPPGNVALVDRYGPGMDGTVVAVEGGVIAHVYPPHLQGEKFDFGDKFKTLNIYRFTREFWNGTLARLITCWASLDESCYYEHVLGMIVYMQRERVHALDVAGGTWAEVDDPNDFNVARFKFNPGERAEILERARGGFWSFDVLDFSLMRSARFPTPGILSALREALPRLLQTYGSAQAALDEKLAYFLL
ncbi:MAG TPA: phosphocholine cytidylyltransferase family protein, partial [Planctomycetota bacterium]|nr:phosphocholine cytidylyltransferase family protein [Planctomycetota bacterium]